MRDFETRLCKSCGGAKFKKWTELDFEEELIAVRKNASEDKKQEHLVCTRCFSILEENEIRI